MKTTFYGFDTNNSACRFVYDNKTKKITIFAQKTPERYILAYTPTARFLKTFGGMVTTRIC